jgi:hypothetical protein
MNKGWIWFFVGAGIVLLFGIGLRLFRFARFFGGFYPFRIFPHSGTWGFFPFGWMMVGMGLIPLLIIVLLVVGIIALLRSSKSTPTSTNTQPLPAPRTCPSCGKQLQADWKHCPYCGANLEG